MPWRWPVSWHSCLHIFLNDTHKVSWLKTKCPSHNENTYQCNNSHAYVEYGCRIVILSWVLTSRALLEGVHCPVSTFKTLGWWMSKCWKCQCQKLYFSKLVVVKWQYQNLQASVKCQNLKTANVQCQNMKKG